MRSVHTVPSAGSALTAYGGWGSASGIFVDTMISPSMESALAQSLQMPGISGMVAEP